jgi:hypothetical protein
VPSSRIESPLESVGSSTRSEGAIGREPRTSRQQRSDPRWPAVLVVLVVYGLRCDRRPIRFRAQRTLKSLSWPVAVQSLSITDSP